MKNHIGTKYTFLGTKSTEKVLKSDEKFCTEVQAQSVLTIGTLKVLKNHERNHHFSRAKVPKTAENQRKKIKRKTK